MSGCKVRKKQQREIIHGMCLIHHSLEAISPVTCLTQEVHYFILGELGRIAVFLDWLVKAAQSRWATIHGRS